MQKAKIVKTQYDGAIRQNRKEKHFVCEFAVLAPDKEQTAREGSYLSRPITARIYATNAMHYACVWIGTGKFYSSGGGKAGGYGYHRASAALQNALDDAGIKLSEPIDGRGEQAMIDALAATAKVLGYRKFHIHQAHA